MPSSGWIADPVGDFLPTYTGPHHPGLDVTAHRVTVNPQRVIFQGKMDGPIASTQAIGGIYIIGLDRGQGAPRFRSGTPLIGPNVLFDSVVRINPNGTGLFNNLAGVVTPLDPADITIDGNVFTASVPLSLLLRGATRPPEQWTYNLWPRNGMVPGQNQHVSDLAPDDGNSPVRVVPPSRPQVATSLFALAPQFANPGSAAEAISPAGFTGLNVAKERFVSTDPSVPPNPIKEAPVFALNDGDSANSDVPEGLDVALTAPPLIESPIFIGLADALPPAVDG